ncbi:MAG: glycosyltransferase [Cetobacterium sp.]
MKKGVLVFPDFADVHLGKDVYMLPKYMQDFYEMEVIYFGEKLSENNVVFRRLGKEKDIFLIKEYIKKVALNLDFIVIFHLTRETYIIIKEYIKYNKNGKIILKLDMGQGEVEQINKKKNKISRFKKNIMMRFILKKSDIICVETDLNYNDIVSKKILGLDITSKLICLKNAFDERSLISEQITIKKFADKKKKIIFVGRIYAPEKNIKMLLESIKNIDLKEWSIDLIGPFNDEIKDYIIKNQINVTLIGNIENKKELYEKYNESKVFILTSNKEGFPIVYAEALRFGNYILTTDVGGAQDITLNGKIGKVVPKNDIFILQNEIQTIIDGNINLEKKYEESIEYCLKDFIWEKNIKKLIEKLMELGIK